MPFFKMNFQSRLVTTSALVLFGLELIRSALSWNPASRNREVLAGRHSTMNFNATTDVLGDHIWSFSHFSQSSPLSWYIHCVYVAGLTALENLAESRRYTQWVCPMGVCPVKDVHRVVLK
jgi:hypothetical protein